MPAADARGDMIAAARDALDEARRRARHAGTIVEILAGLLATALREQGHSDRTIAAALDVSRTRVGELINQAPWLKLGAHLAPDEWTLDWVDELYRHAQHAAPASWV